MLRRMTAILLGGAYLGLALSGTSPVVLCAAALEPCSAGEMASCVAESGRACCSHGDQQDSRPDCCVTIPEGTHDWVVPASVKVPDMTESEWLIFATPLAVELVRSLYAPTQSNAPDPPGPAGRSLLTRVSRQLV